ILDDEASVLDLLDQYLRPEGYECALCATASDALERLEEQRYSVALIDLALPDMDGIEVVERVREVNKEIGLIVITGTTEVHAVVAAMRAGADDYLVKPLNLCEISVAMAKVIEKRTLVAENRRHREYLEERIREATATLEATNRELRETKEYLENLLHSTVDAIITTDLSGRISFVNEGALQMLGYGRAELVGSQIGEFLVGGEDEARHLRRLVRKDKPLQNYESEIRHTNGRAVPVSMSVSLVHDADGKPASWLAIGKDITEQKRLDQELKEMSIKDSLTGLYNHRHFYDRLEDEIERTRRQGHPLSLLVIDLDQFKWYNDCHGHLAGDNVLRAVGVVIMECTRGHVDLGCRYGGDEFTVILPETDELQAQDVAERIRATFEHRSFERVTMSIGVKEFSSRDSLRRFIQLADETMYEAKRSGGNRVCSYEHREPPAGLEDIEGVKTEGSEKP
ncbi:MAG TPA: diguanylate cyclase, partial [Candidatus Hydrogenedentes bacterium]|nr:diguanylate cyclase [Candidatus Hydrogenedentota bacterium]